MLAAKLEARKARREGALFTRRCRRGLASRPVGRREPLTPPGSRRAPSSPAFRSTTSGTHRTNRRAAPTLILIDANLLLYAYHTRAEQHAKSRVWLDRRSRGPTSCVFSWLTLWAFLRIGTSRRCSTGLSRLQRGRSRDLHLACAAVRGHPRTWGAALGNPARLGPGGPSQRAACHGCGSIRNRP